VTTPEGNSSHILRKVCFDKLQKNAKKHPKGGGVCAEKRKTAKKTGKSKRVLRRKEKREYKKGRTKAEMKKKCLQKNPSYHTCQEGGRNVLLKRGEQGFLISEGRAYQLKRVGV